MYNSDLNDFIKFFCKYIINLKLDDKYTKYVLDNLILFKFINPNIITLIGLLADFFILYFLINKLLFFLALSLLSDILLTV